VAVISGAILTALLALPGVEGPSQDSRIVTDVAAALAVGLGTMIMVATSTEHPPAAGTALGLVISPWSWSAIVFIMSSALALSIVRIALRPRLVNLLCPLRERTRRHEAPVT
jgi:CBS-domain-containing membrane protein